MILKGYAVTYGVLDDYFTVFDRGSFANLTLPIPLLYAHQYSRIPVGLVLEAREDDTGLIVVAEVFESNRSLVEYTKKAGQIDASVGFNPVLPDGIRIDDNDIIHFTEVELLEVSVTPWGAVPGAELEPDTSARN